MMLFDKHIHNNSDVSGQNPRKSCLLNTGDFMVRQVGHGLRLRSFSSEKGPYN